MSGQFGNGASGASPPSLIARVQHEYTVAEVLPLLKGVRPSGEGWAVRCPVHGDQNSSASIKVGDKQPLIFHCFKGCTFEQFIAAVQDPQTRKDTGSDTPPSPLTEVGAYVYRNADGTLFGKKKRFVDEEGKKTFRWSPALGDKKAPLYRVNEIQGGLAVALAEGEKDVDTLRKLGIKATCNPDGAAMDFQKPKWVQAHTDQLVAAGVQRVAIFPDNDDAGRAHALAEAASCHAAGLLVRVVSLPGLPEKGDITDWMAGHTKTELFEVLKSTPVWTPSEPVHTPDVPAAEEKKPAGMRTIWMSTVKKKPIEWLWEGRIPLGMLTIFAGDPKEGKSNVSREIASCLSTGRPWPVSNERPTVGVSLFLAAEDHLEYIVRPSLEAMQADMEKIGYVTMTTAEGEDRLFSLQTDLAELRAEVKKTGARFVVLDPINAYLGENVDNYKDPDVRRVLTPLAKLAEELNIAIVLIMHLTKDEQRQILYRAGGSMAFVAVVRSIFVVTHDPENRNRKMFAHMVLQMRRRSKTLAFTFKDENGALLWEEKELDITVDELFNPERGKGGKKVTKVEWAEAWLRKYLGDSPKLSSAVVEAAEANGIKDDTLRRAQQNLGVEAKQAQGLDPKTGTMRSAWFWYPPAKEAEGEETPF